MYISVTYINSCIDIAAYSFQFFTKDDNLILTKEQLHLLCVPPTKMKIYRLLPTWRRFIYKSIFIKWKKLLWM